MKVFISWSKEPSRTVAKELSEWLPTVIQAIEPWMSEEDIPAGSRWNSQISNQLATTSFGIICVTPQNQNEPWIQFEAGALAKAVEAKHGEITDTSRESYVCPYLVGMSKASLVGPLTAFQSAEANRRDTLHLLKSLNKALAADAEKPLRDEILETSFDRAWGQLESKLNSLPESSLKTSKRQSDEILAEILETVRDTNRKVRDVSLFSPSGLWRDSNYAPAIRSFRLNGSEENIKKAVIDIKRYERQLDAPFSVDLKNPHEADITMVGASFTLDDLLRAIKALSKRLEISFEEL